MDKNYYPIRYFKGFYNLELKDVGQFNLLVGANNSGKTCLLRTIATAIDAITNDNSCGLILPDSHLEPIDTKNITSLKEILELLQSVDCNITSFDTIRDIPYIGYSDREIPVKYFGNGIKRLVFIALKLLGLKDGVLGVLLIDEIENSIHTEALEDAFKWIVKWCKELNIQLFATTHSLEVIDAFLEVTNDNDDLVLYRLERKDKETSALRIGRDRLQRLRENTGQDVRW